MPISSIEREWRINNGLCVVCLSPRDTDRSSIFCQSCLNHIINQQKIRNTDNIKNNRCTRCSQPNTNGKKYCDECLLKIGIKAKIDYQNRDKSVCHCGNQIFSEKVKCEECIEKFKIRANKRKHTLKSQNKCTKCEKPVPLSHTQFWCEACLETHRNIAKDDRIAVFKAYGDKCFCCGETINKFLTIDHINGGGGQHRRELGDNKIYRWLIQNDFPKDFRLLCYNCNCGREYNPLEKGLCPHKTEKFTLDKLLNPEFLTFLPKSQYRSIYTRYQKWKNKLKVFSNYGNKCSCCGENNLMFLSMDHILGNGSEHRQEKMGNICTYKWIIKNKYPNIFQIACFNCNCGPGKATSKKCPHQSPSPALDLAVDSREDIIDTDEINEQ